MGSSFVRFLVSSSVLLVSAVSVVAAQEEEDVLFTGCSEANYYSEFNVEDIPSWTRASVELLLKETHRNTLPYTADDSADDDVWNALAHVDYGGNNTVRLIYSSISVPAQPHGTTTTWNREHLWPSSRGVDHSGSDFTDIHHLRAADWNINSARNNLYFGNCVSDNCQSPAHSEAANDTAKDSTIFTPPFAVRGDIARALFYMDVRYSVSSNTNEVDLQLTDCPDGSSEKHQMAYLSVLLQWHTDDRVSVQEVQRNDRVCERWQGNRNPFVDFPDLAQAIFGEPASVPYNCNSSTSNDGTGNETEPPAEGAPTQSPTTTDTVTPPAASTGSSAAILSPGDIMVVAVHSDDPDLIALVSLVDLPIFTILYMTDKAWTGVSGFRSNEGTIVLTVPAFLSAGTIFGYGEGLLYGDAWTSPDKGFSLSASGDTLLVYWHNGGNDATSSSSSVHHLGAFSFSGPWLEPELDAEAYGTDSSALPDSLAAFGVSLKHADNYVYNGPVTGTKASIQASMQDPTNWLGSNSERVFEESSIPASFVIQSSSSSSSATPVRSAPALPLLMLSIGMMSVITLVL
jgi:endonuclease I